MRLGRNPKGWREGRKIVVTISQLLEPKWRQTPLVLKNPSERNDLVIQKGPKLYIHIYIHIKLYIYERSLAADIGAGTLCEGVPDPTRVDSFYNLVPKPPTHPRGSTGRVKLLNPQPTSLLLLPTISNPAGGTVQSHPPTRRMSAYVHACDVFVDGSFSVGG